MPIPGGSRLPLAWSAIAGGASPGLRTIPLYSCLLMRPRAGPVRRRQLDWRALLRRELVRRELERRHLRLRQHVPSKTPRSLPRKSRGQTRRQASPNLARRRRQAQTDIRTRSRNHPRRNHPRRSSSSLVPPPFRCFTAANWPIPSSIMIVRASWKPRKFCRRHRHWVEC
jgi:hypothetical protein